MPGKCCRNGGHWIAGDTIPNLLSRALLPHSVPSFSFTLKLTLPGDKSLLPHLLLPLKRCKAFTVHGRENKSLPQTLAGTQPRTCHPRNRWAEGRVPNWGARAAADIRLFFSRSGLPPTRGSGAAVGAAVTRAARGPAPCAREEAGPRPGSPLAAADVAARSPPCPTRRRCLSRP